MTIHARMGRCLVTLTFSALISATPSPSWLATAFTTMESVGAGNDKSSPSSSSSSSLFSSLLPRKKTTPSTRLPWDEMTTRRDRSFGIIRRHSKRDEGDDVDDDRGLPDCEEDVDTFSASASFRRRTLLQSMLGAAGGPALAAAAVANDDDDDDDGSSTTPIVRGEVIEIRDPNGYSAVAYIPPSSRPQPDPSPSAVETLPLLLVLHGAGRNRHSALYEFTHAPNTNDTPGDHIHLPPYLLSAHRAPSSLSHHFVVVAPYVGKDRRSLYDDPRADILSFLAWFCDRWIDRHTFVDPDDAAVAITTKIRLSPQRRYLFGFSEGATLAVELATTRKFRGAILASYGFRGRLPSLALERLRGVAVWAFHSKGDDVYDVRCSEGLVESLLLENGGGNSNGGNHYFWMEGGDVGIVYVFIDGHTLKRLHPQWHGLPGGTTDWIVDKRIKQFRISR